MFTRLYRRAIPFALALFVACDGTVLSEPSRPVPLRLVAGEYELVAGGQTISPEWGTEWVRFEGLLTLQQDPITPTKVSGAFKELRFVEGGISVDDKLEGAIVGSIDANGALLLDLISQSGDRIWSGRGVVVDSLITGQWQSKDWAAGGFSATLRPGGVR